MNPSSLNLKNECLLSLLDNQAKLMKMKENFSMHSGYTKTDDLSSVFVDNDSLDLKHTLRPSNYSIL